MGKVLAIFAVAACCACAGGIAQNRSHASAAASTTAAPPPEARVDINHASVDELMRVRGLTRPWAERIVRFRPYRTKQDLLDRGVVSSQVYDRIKDFVIAHRDRQ